MYEAWNLNHHGNGNEIYSYQIYGWSFKALAKHRMYVEIWVFSPFFTYKHQKMRIPCVKAISWGGIVHRDCRVGRRMWLPVIQHSHGKPAIFDGQTIYKRPIVHGKLLPKVPTKTSCALRAPWLAGCEARQCALCRRSLALWSWVMNPLALQTWAPKKVPSHCNSCGIYFMCL